ncbi:hypothetical protein D9M68_479100 [compost metagenome]
MGVGDGHDLAAAVVGDGARHRARALRADLERARVVDARDAAAACADDVHVHHLGLDRIVGHQAAGSEQRPQLGHQRHVGAGAAHVEGDQVGQAGHAAQLGCADHAGGRARHAGAYRGREHRFHRHQASVGMHRGRLGGHAHAAHGAHQIAHVAGHARAHIGIERGGGHAFVFAELRQDLAGHAQVDARQMFGQDVAGAAFMRIVAVAVHEADGDRFDAGRGQFARHRHHLVLVQRL